MRCLYEECNRIRTIQPLPLNQAHQWSVPPNGMIKINVDAATRKSVHSFGVAVVGHDHFGVVIFAVVHCLPRKFSPHLARDMQHMSTRGHPCSTAAEFETDAKLSLFKQSINRIHVLWRLHLLA